MKEENKVAYLYYYGHMIIFNSLIAIKKQEKIKIFYSLKF